MAVPESQVEEVVRETSERMEDPGFAQLAVAAFVHAQPQLSQYIASRAARLGGQDAVLQLLFHANLLAECFHRNFARDLPLVDGPTLDAASQGNLLSRLSEREPAVASYVVSNTDDPRLRDELARVGLAFSLVCARRGLKN